MTGNCKNCNQHFTGRFCNNCGQSADTHPINFHFIRHDIQHAFVHVDKGFLYTVKQLFTRPGLAIKEFIEGKRIQHFKPLSFVLILAGLYGFLYHSFHINPLISPSTEGNKLHHYTEINEWIATHYAFTTLLSIPILALSSYLGFKKEKYNYAVNLVLATYLSGLFIIIRLIFFPMLLLNKNMPVLSLMIPAVIGLVFSVWAYFQFFSRSTFKQKIWRTILTYVYSFIGNIIIVLIAATIAETIFDK